MVTMRSENRSFVRKKQAPYIKYQIITYYFKLLQGKQSQQISLLA